MSFGKDVIWMSEWTNRWNSELSDRVCPVGPYKHLLEMSLFLDLNFVGNDIVQDESENMNAIQSLSVCQGVPE